MGEKVRCRAMTTHGPRCRTLTDEVREWGEKLFPCCKRHPQWFWERFRPVGARGPNPYEKDKVVPDFRSLPVILSVKGTSVMDTTGKEAVKLLKELVESSHTEYMGEGDEYGSCIHCRELSFRPHAKDCPWKAADDFIKGLKP